MLSIKRAQFEILARKSALVEHTRYNISVYSSFLTWKNIKNAFYKTPVVEILARKGILVVAKALVDNI